MNMKNLLVFFGLLFFPLHAYELMEDFDISSFWHDGMTWNEFRAVRNTSKREGLVKYVDKIQQQKLARDLGIEVPLTYITSQGKVPLQELLCCLPSYVAKMTHLSFSEGLLIVKDGTNMITGELITPEQVEQEVFQSIHTKPRDVESWALHQVKPGFMIQEYIPNRMEVKIQTIWGKAVIGEWRGGERPRYTTPIWGRYDRDGNMVDGPYEAPVWWANAVAFSEKVAVGTDALRVDFLVREDGTLLLNELEIWTESNWSSMQSELERALNDGYRAWCCSKSDAVQR